VRLAGSLRGNDAQRERDIYCLLEFVPGAGGATPGDEVRVGGETRLSGEAGGSLFTGRGWKSPPRGPKGRAAPKEVARSAQIVRFLIFCGGSLAQTLALCLHVTRGYGDHSPLTTAAAFEG
jgi:hypothetical protein